MIKLETKKGDAMNEEMPIHINNVIPGGADLFVAIPELDGGPGEKKETRIASGCSDVVFIKERNAIGLLVPVKSNEDPWLLVSNFFSVAYNQFLSAGDVEKSKDLFSWPNRAAIAARLVSQIQLDILEGKYSLPGRPNCETVIGVLTWPAKELEPYQEELSSYLNIESDQTNDQIDGPQA